MQKGCSVLSVVQVCMAHNTFTPTSGLPLGSAVIGGAGLGVGVGHVLQQGNPKACLRLQRLHNLSLDSLLDASLKQHLHDCHIQLCKKNTCH